MMTQSTPAPTNLDERARKRAAIGLAPQRPTAKANLFRPPRASESRTYLWLVALWVVSVVVATLLLVIARLIGSSTAWPQVQAELNAWVAPPTANREQAPAFTSNRYQLALGDEFDGAAGLLAINHQDEQWTLAPLPAEGIYHMRIWPNRLAWSTLGAQELSNYSLEGSLVIADLTPDGYAGLLARYQNRDNFYLFAVDGRQRVQIQLLAAGRLQTLMPWTYMASLSPAGQPNLLALEDNGLTLRFYANGAPLFEVGQPQLPLGDAGVFGAAPADTLAEIVLDWLRVYRTSIP
jgi:hypothetical protein